jgi:formamidopyrimidine-DNA glycosylase
MPELPEVETVRRALDSVVAGTAIEEATITDPRLTRPHAPELVEAELVGQRIASVGRRGKYLMVVFDAGGVLLVHLRMTGSFRVVPRASLPVDVHRRAVLRLDNGSDVAYRDVRRFGTWEHFGPGEVDGYLGDRLGPEPFARVVGGRWLVARLASRTIAVKAALLDQRVLAGLGNIYADEALWRARIHPLRQASSLDAAEATRVVRAVRTVLRLGIERQGATLRDYATPDGEGGAMQAEFRVYGREGEPCERCGALLVRTVVAGRGTTFCARCQPSDDGGATRPR